MSRIQATFDALKADGRRALIPYVTAGFPFADITPELMHGMVAAGADVIELGVPFSDPMADGPVIQKAGEAALALGVGMKQVLAMVAADLSGMSKAETERIWLPFALWLLPAAAALPGAGDRSRWWLAAQAATALAVNHLWLTRW